MKRTLVNVLVTTSITVLAIGLISISYQYGRLIPISDQLYIYDKIRGTSAIIFAVMGAWVAIVYPQALRNIFRSTYGGKEDKILSSILTSMQISSLVIFVALAIDFFVPLVENISIFFPYEKQINGSSYSILALLFVAQSWSIILTILPVDEANIKIRRAKRTKDNEDKFLGKK